VSEILVKDVGDIINAGRRVIIRCLLHIQKILESSEFHYLFNKLYMNPYICWLQKISDDDLYQFSLEFNKMIGMERVFSKHTFDLELDIIEQCALAEDEIPDTDNVSNSSDSEGHCDSSYSSESSSEDATERSSLEEEEGQEIQNLTKATQSILLDDQIGTGILGTLENLATSLPASSDESSNNKEVKKNQLITEL
jgi:hypothetical protein